MIQKDYIIRLIAQLSQVLSKIIFARQAKNFDQALQIAQTTYEELFGLSGEMVHKLDPETLAQLLNDKEKIKGLAALLREEGNVFLEKGNTQEGRSRFRKSLGLYEAVVKMQGKQDENCQEAIEILQLRLAKIESKSRNQ